MAASGLAAPATTTSALADSAQRERNEKREKTEKRNKRIKIGERNRKEGGGAVSLSGCQRPASGGSLAAGDGDEQGG